MKNKILNFLWKTLVYIFFIFSGLILLYFLSVDILKIKKFIIDFGVAGKLMLWGYVLIWIVLSVYVIRFIEFLIVEVKKVLEKRKVINND